MLDRSRAVVLCLVLSACGGGGGSGGPGAGPEGSGSVSGRLVVPGAPEADPRAEAGVLAAPPPAAPPPAEADFVPGEVLVRFEAGVEEAAAADALTRRYADVGLRHVGPVYPGGPHLFRTDAYNDGRLARAEARRRTLHVVDRLEAEPSVDYAEPNYRVAPTRLPNDPAFRAGLQWDLRMLNLPPAWDVTTGRSDVVVAVLDTGIRRHPDVDRNLVAGFDFVSDPMQAGDGDGIDPDPTDPPSPIASFHGTQVAGIVGASGDNGAGVSGVAWTARVMPIRVLDLVGGGPLTDLVNGIRYAAGLSNASGRTPDRRADVLNLSLGGAGACPRTLQETIAEVRATGAVMVAAAGNEALAGNPATSPASCAGVIAVGAVDPRGRRAPYSSVQPYVALVAPGGDERLSPFAMVLSTLNVSSAGESLYAFSQGTSVAAPHVSGVVALMISAARDAGGTLSPDDVEAILAATAIDLGPAGRDAEHGAGLVDAGAAVARAGARAAPRDPVPYSVESLLAFGEIGAPASIETPILNVGGGTLVLADVEASVLTPPGGQWLSAALRDDPACLSALRARNCILDVAADPAGLTPGLYAGRVLMRSNGGDLSIPTLMRVGAAEVPDLGAITVRLLAIDPSTDRLAVAATTTTARARGYAYAFESVPAGRYIVEAGTDRDGSGFFGDAPGEVSGIFPFPGAPEAIDLAPGQRAEGIDFLVSEQQLILDERAVGVFAPSPAPAPAAPPPAS